MANCAFLSVGSFDLEETYEGLDPDIMMLFRPSDGRMKRIDHNDRQALAKYVRDDDICYFDEDNPLTSIEYRCSVQVAKDRLDLKGFTRDVSEAIFQREMPSAIRAFEEWGNRFIPRPTDHKDQLAALRSLTIEDWLRAMQEIREGNLSRMPRSEWLFNENMQPILRYMLGYSLGAYGFPGGDIRPFIRLVIDEMPYEDELVYDLTDLTLGDHWQSADDVRENANHIISGAEFQMQADFLLERRVIVLTEGRSDKAVLERSLKLLYPHLADYFHFFDFTGNEGGASQLVRLVKAFASADVRHRILALFDNDTGAKEALSNLDLASLPQNITVSHYPDLALAQSYPTKGPSGQVEMNINGLAGSLELYLGRDVLQSENGRFAPIQWTGYSQKMDAYQGEVLGKSKIQERFWQKLETCESNRDRIDSFDWQGLRDVLSEIRTAFHNIDKQAALGRHDC